MQQQEKLRKEEKQKLELERLKGVMKSRDKTERTRVQDDSRTPVMRVNLANSKTDIAYGYIKKDCVFRVTGEEGGQFLFQAIDKDDMLAWIKVINLATERASVIRHKSVLNEIDISESEIPKNAPKREVNGETSLSFFSSPSPLHPFYLYYFPFYLFFFLLLPSENGGFWHVPAPAC